MGQCHCPTGFGVNLPFFLNISDSTKDKLENRPVNNKNPKPFKTLFRLDEIDHLKPINNGFKYYLTLNNKNFWNKHISDKYSGEIKLEKVDRERITSAFKNLSIKIIKS